ncbi:methyl-accepting chemotaxis protein [Lachnospiraceae bacterium KHCPX20]|nr:methyl-accepting chemotaxis protein [Lachnospiraceae bacterium KHCPX20]
MDKDGKKVKDNKVSLIRSVRGKVTVFSIAMVLVVMVALIWSTVPSSQATLTETTKNYLNDIALAYGSSVEADVNAVGVEHILNLENLSHRLTGVGVEGITSSYAYVVDGKGVMLFHPTAEKIGKPVENEVVKGLVAQIQSGKTPNPKNAVVEYKFNGETKYASYYVPDDGSFILVISADESEVLAPSKGILNRSVVIGIIISILAAILMTIMLIIILRPVQMMSDFINKMALLDFSEDEAGEALAKRQDEFGVMARATVHLQKTLANVISEIKGQSEILYSSSNSMLKHAEDMNETTAQVDRSVCEIAEGASSQAGETQSASENVITIGNMIEETNNEVNNLSNTASSMKASHQTALSILQELGRTNEQTKSSIAEIEAQTKTTNLSAGKIREATSFITAIAEETNLLSLNASIEAARAGEAGRGFAVVASQIQKLAEQSNDSAKQIENIVDELIRDSDRAVQTMDSVKDIIQRQSEDVDRTKAAFGEVSDGIDDSIGGINSIADKVAQMDTARVSVVDTVSNLSAIAEENAASTEESSATVSTITGIANEIEDSSSDLRKIAETLEQKMDAFKY